MIENKSFEVYKELVKENKYKYIFDITIIYQVNETLENEDIEMEENDFIILCNLVKSDYLKNDIELNDELVMKCFNILGRI